MIDHVALHVRDFGASKSFYDRVLPAIGYEPVLTYEHAIGYGRDGKPSFWIVQQEPVGGATHVAFECDERKSVDFFHAAAVAAGGTDNGAPGSASTTTRPTTAPTCSTPTATTWKRSATASARRSGTPSPPTA